MQKAWTMGFSLALRASKAGHLPSWLARNMDGQGQLMLLAREMVVVGREAAAFDHTALLPSCCWWEEQAC